MAEQDWAHKKAQDLHNYFLRTALIPLVPLIAKGLHQARAEGFAAAREEAAMLSYVVADPDGNYDCEHGIQFGKCPNDGCAMKMASDIQNAIRKLKDKNAVLTGDTKA